MMGGSCDTFYTYVDIVYRVYQKSGISLMYSIALSFFLR